MRIIFVFLLYVVTWFVFAVFDFKGSDTIVAYSLRPVSPPIQNKPKMITQNPIVYRISGQNVVSQIGGFEPERHSDCAVVDTENWVCTWSYGSGKFGFRNGEYYTKSLKTGVLGADKRQIVPRFRWIMNDVRWQNAESGWQPFLILFTPFVK
jgi:hypothetical protein